MIAVIFFIIYLTERAGKVVEVVHIVVFQTCQNIIRGNRSVTQGLGIYCEDNFFGDQLIQNLIDF